MAKHRHGQRGRRRIEDAVEVIEPFPVDRRSGYRHRIAMSDEDDPARAAIVERACRKRIKVATEVATGIDTGVNHGQFEK